MTSYHLSLYASVQSKYECSQWINIQTLKPIFRNYRTFMPCFIALLETILSTTFVKDRITLNTEVRIHISEIEYEIFPLIIL